MSSDQHISVMYKFYLQKQEFLNHVNKHHSWLLKKGDNQVVFSKVIGNQAKTQKDVYYLKTQDSFRNIVEETSNRESLLILEELGKLINKNIF